MPDKATDCVAGVTFANVTTADAVLSPWACGWNVTLTTHEALAATDAQELDCVKSEGFVPVKVMPETVSAWPPEFMIEKVSEEVAPTAVDAKLRLDGLSDGIGGGTT